MTQPTQEQCDRLAKAFQVGQTGYDDDWRDLYLDPDSKGVVVTHETIVDFRAASTGWSESCKAEEVDGGLYWDRIQVRAGRERVAVAIIDCGDYRLVYEQ